MDIPKTQVAFDPRHRTKANKNTKQLTDEQNCSNSVVFYYWILELFQQCGIFLLDFRTVPTVWYFSIGIWNCSNSVVFFYWILELFRQCGIFLLDFGTVPTVVFFFSFYNRLFTRGINVSVIYQNDMHMYILLLA